MNKIKSISIILDNSEITVRITRENDRTKEYRKSIETSSMEDMDKHYDRAFVIKNGLNSGLLQENTPL